MISIKNFIKVWLFALALFGATNLHAAATASSEMISERILDVGCNHNVSALAFSPDGNYLAIGIFQAYPASKIEVDLFDLQSGEIILNFTPDGQVFSLAFSPDGSILAIATCNKLAVYNLKDKKFIQPSLFNGAVSALAFSPDGKVLAMGDLAGGIRLWNLTTNKWTLSIKCNPDVHAISFNPNGNVLAFFGENIFGLGIQVLDLNTNRCIQVFDIINQNCGYVRIAATFSHDGGLLAFMYNSGIFELWDLNTKSYIMVKSVPYVGLGKWDASIAFSADGTQIAAGRDNKIVIWTNLLAQKAMLDMKPQLFALACAQHPRLGCESPAQNVSPWILQLIADSYKKSVPTWQDVCNLIAQQQHPH
jgi:WD40 repeat protein